MTEVSGMIIFQLRSTLASNEDKKREIDRQIRDLTEDSEVLARRIAEDTEWLKTLMARKEAEE